MASLVIKTQSSYMTFVHMIWMKCPVKLQHSRCNCGSEHNEIRLLMPTSDLADTAVATSNSDRWQGHHFLGGGSPLAVTGPTLASVRATRAGCTQQQCQTKPPHIPNHVKKLDDHSYRTHSIGSEIPKPTTVATDMEGIRARL